VGDDGDHTLCLQTEPTDGTAGPGETPDAG